MCKTLASIIAVLLCAVRCSSCMKTVAKTVSVSVSRKTGSPGQIQNPESWASGQRTSPVVYSTVSPNLLSLKKLVLLNLCSLEVYVAHTAQQHSRTAHSLS